MKWYLLLPIIVVLFLFNPTKSFLSDKPKINFVNDDKLMWLVDVNSEQYNLYTKEEYYKKYKRYYTDINHYECNMKIEKEKYGKPYECYLEKINHNSAYKYSDWRLPTSEELLRLEIKRPYFMRWFVSERYAENTKGFDINSFYDEHASSASINLVKLDDYGYDSEEKQIYKVIFSSYRYPHKLIWNKRQRGFVSRPIGASAYASYAYQLSYIRLVRDREPSEYLASRAWSGLLLLLIGLLLYKTPNMWREVKKWWRDIPVEKLEEKYREKD